MTDKAYNPKPKAGAYCVVCCEPVACGPAFVASKPRRGGATIYAHTECLEQEQRDAIFNKSLAAYEVFAKREGDET